MTSAYHSRPAGSAVTAREADQVGAVQGPESRWRRARPAVRSGLTSLAVVGGSGLALGGVYATTGLGIPCPLKLITGLDCPLCGGTRMAGALLHGDVAAAFTYNPLALVGVVVAGVLGIAWLVELLGGPRLRLPSAWRRRLAGVPARAWWGLGIAVTVGYMLLRNLVWPIPA